MGLVIRWIIMTLAVLVTSYILPGAAVAGVWTAVLVALVLGIINAIIRPILVVLTLPITIVTLGLFVFVINAALVQFADALVSGFAVTNFWWALLFSLILSIVYSLLQSVLEHSQQDM